MNHAPAVATAALLLALVATPQVAAQTAPTASPDRVVLGEFGERAQLLLTGDTRAFTGANVVDREGRPVRGISAALGRNSGRELPLIVSLQGAAAGTYLLDLLHSRGTTRVRVAIIVEAANRPPTVSNVDVPSGLMEGEAFQVVVSASDDNGVAEIRASWPGGRSTVRTRGLDVVETVRIEGLAPGVHQVTVEAVDDQGKASESRTVQAQVEAGFEPVAVATGTLSMTGRRFAPVTISTGGLSMVGWRFVPVAISTGGLTMVGRRFRPVRISAPALSMTGQRGGVR